jgi:hypothetical protein
MTAKLQLMPEESHATLDHPAAARAFHSVFESTAKPLGQSF